MSGVILYADEVYLKNDDRISGKIISENKEKIVIDTEAVGRLSIQKEFIKEIRSDERVISKVKVEKEKSQSKLWKRKFTLGYNESRGNTKKSELSSEFSADRKTENNEINIKANTFYSSSEKKMDSQKYYLLGRYAFSFGKRKWYNFYKTELDHDRFANINYRIIPSTGVGYWFSDTEDLKAMVEGAVGFEHTDYRDQTPDRDEAVLIPRAFFDKEVFSKSRISQDITFYSFPDDISEYRLRSETIFKSPLKDNLSLRFSLIDEYNSDPPADVQKNDIRFISGLELSF